MIVFFVDTHCHLNIDTFEDRIIEILDRANQADVFQIVIPGFDLCSSEKALELASKYSYIYAAVGIHPNEVNQFNQQQLRQLEGLIREPKSVAVGEIGLDFYHHPEEEAKQVDLLHSMLDLASINQKPVILHSRNSLEKLLEIIQQWIDLTPKSFNGPRGVFHGFEGDGTQSKIVQHMNMMIGVGGPITYKNAQIKQSMVKDAGINTLVLETDSPYLSPHPFRGQENEPSRIPLIAQKIADLLELSIDKVAEITTRNAQILFRLESNH